MYFHSFDALRLFVIVGHHVSFTAAGVELNLTKGAVGYQIKQLERELGFALFVRRHGGILLTEKGQLLWHRARLLLTELEADIAKLRRDDMRTITIGMSTYFASRWLSPRLMRFMTQYPEIRLRIQPVIGLGDLRAEQLDMMIRWGKGGWTDVSVEPLFGCPAMITAGLAIARDVEHQGIAAVLPQSRLLHDAEGSEVWAEWYEAAGLPYQPKQDGLVIADPNVRVQAVVNGQGLALNDALVTTEIESGHLFLISPIVLPEYGYHLAYREDALAQPDLCAFRDWMVGEVAAVT